jgi:hypothetical protein
MALFAASFAVAAIAIASRAARPHTTLSAYLDAGGRLDLTLFNSEESFADLASDHGKPLHLFLIREPEADVLLHLHPQQTRPGHFVAQLPAMPAGRYALFADLYHRAAPIETAADTDLASHTEPAVRNETATLTLNLPAERPGAASDPDDSFAMLPALSHSSAAAEPLAGPGSLLSAAAAPASSEPTFGSGFIAAQQSPPADSGDGVSFVDGSNDALERAVSFGAQSRFALRTDVLGDGYIMQLRSLSQLKPLEASQLEVTLLAPGGAAPVDMLPYLGTTAHAIVLRTGDASPTPLRLMSLRVADLIFAHIRSDGTLAASAAAVAVSNIAAIPYGFPAAGRYRIFVQMKHGHVIETGAFDVDVD